MTALTLVPSITISANYTLQPHDYGTILFIDSSLNPVNITLPLLPDSTFDYQCAVICSNNGHNITLTPNAQNNFNGCQVTSINAQVLTLNTPQIGDLVFVTGGATRSTWHISSVSGNVTIA